MEKITVYTREVEGRRFYFFEMGSEYHGKPSCRIWVSPRLITKADDLYLELPLQGVELEKGQKDYILRPGDKNLFNVFVKCGYRGTSKIEVLTPATSVVEYEFWDSPLGNLGTSRGALVLTESASVKFRWRRSGRLRGAPAEGVTVVYLDGTTVDIEGAEEDALASLSE